MKQLEYVTITYLEVDSIESVEIYNIDSKILTELTGYVKNNILNNKRLIVALSNEAKVNPMISDNIFEVGQFREHLCACYIRKFAEKKEIPNYNLLRK